MPKKRDPDACPICDQDVEVKGKIGGEWYDGKRYDEICYVCASTIKQYTEIGDKWVKCENESKVHVRTVDEMAELGWSTKEKKKIAETSIKAVKAALKRGRKGIA